MIKQKREELERFIREQIIGPGATGYRFIDTQEEELLSKNLYEYQPILYDKEVINNAPGALYGTGILFPVDNSNTAISETDPDPPLEGQENDVHGAHENMDDTLEGESLNINQMYPNTMGFTCCLGKNVDVVNEIKIKVTGRYYSKVEREILSNRFGLLLENNESFFRDFIASLNDDELIKRKLTIRNVNGNVILLISPVTTNEISDIKTRLREIDRNKAAELGSDKERQYLSGYKEYLFRELKYNVTIKDEQKQIEESIKSIEAYENCIAHLNDLISIFDSRGYGLWKSKTIEEEVKVPAPLPEEINGKIIYSYNRYEELKEIFKADLGHDEQASLSVNLQFSKDSRDSSDNLYLKVQLVNTSTPFTIPEGDSRYFSVFNEVVNQKSFFGVGLSLKSTKLIPYRNSDLSGDKTNFDEDEVTRFLYRQFQDYAVGHGCSVKWSDKDTVETEYIPGFEIPDVDPTPRIKNSIIDNIEEFEPENVFKDSRFMQFKWLSNFSEATNIEVIEGLESFVFAYEDWIDRKRELYTYGQHSSIAKQELDKCEADKDRMLSNIRHLLAGAEGDDNMLSFRLMNSAMFMQLWHSVNVKNETVDSFINREEFYCFDQGFYKDVKDDFFKKNVSAAWRPFQLAFLLLNLDGIFQRKDDPEWEYRNEWVDLVWFPTGGGKTEAYLGIIALTIISRRRSHAEIGGGTAVMMRYTLRLLTLQQFQRATLLIMALELIRRWNLYSLGEEPIYIGLWVGKGSLPNSLDDLENEYNNIRTAQSEGKNKPSSKIPFDKCPWCGHPLNLIATERIYDSNSTYDYNRVLLRCSHPEYKCSFSSPLRKKLRRQNHGPIPVSLCDEEIYQHPPALLFGTVDKFAQLAHKVSNNSQSRHKDSRRLFGSGNWENGKPRNGYLTPDLIIQDELHLLLGPLGSSVALFESAIDQLCTREHTGLSLRPKVISSTATTRNTDLQIMALFDRKLNIFPKPGVECDDSFYAFYERTYKDSNGELPIYHSKRKYVGILPTGRTQMWMQMRLTAIMLVHRAVFEAKHLVHNTYPIESNYSDSFIKVMDNYHTVLSYFNSRREVGKTESQIHTYIIKEIRRVFNRVMRPGKMMHGLYTYLLTAGELTGRLSGEEVKQELNNVGEKWRPKNRFAHIDEIGTKRVGFTPPDIVVATNMISVGIDISRFNTIIINSMPRNLAEYIQATSRVARNTFGLVVTVHHPFRARDISHYEKFIEFHEKMYSYVEPISITPFTKKAVERYFGLYLATMLRHTTQFVNRNSASQISSMSQEDIDLLLGQLIEYFILRERRLANMKVDDLIKNLLNKDSINDIRRLLATTIEEWKSLSDQVISDGFQLVFNTKAKNSNIPQEQLYVEIDEYESNIHSKHWQIPQSLRVIEPEAVIKIKSR